MIRVIWAHPSLTSRENREVELVLVRHAEPGRPEDTVLRADPGLSADGRSQAKAVADRLCHESWHALYTSPQRRSLETAAPIGDALGLEATVVEGLAEFDFGHPYVHLEDLMKVGNELMAAFRREDFSAYDTDAAAIRERAVTTVEGIIGAHPGQRVVVVTHGTVINAFVGGFIGARKLVFHHPAYTGVTHVMASRRGDREIVRLNDSTHLRLPWPALEKELK
jgi:broad specificity phosphatase PhoE